MEKSKEVLWEVGCEGHSDAWVVAPNWEMATVEAARFWEVPWREVAAKCVEKGRIARPPHNVCCRCKRIYYGKLPMCDACVKVAKTEEQETRRRLKLAYQRGRFA